MVHTEAFSFHKQTNLPHSYITVVNICLWKGTFTLQLLHETWENISLHLRSCVVLEVQ